MRNFFLTLAFLAYILSIKAQDKEKSKLDLIQGIWGNIMNSEMEYSYKIIKGTKSLGISHTNDFNKLDFYLLESIEGFQNYKYEDADSININSLNENGKYFTSIIYKEEINKKGWVKMQYCIVPEYFECDGGSMSINGGQLVEFVKINKLPIITLKLLYKRGKLDNRNYIKEYLNIKVTEIAAPKSIVYSEPNKPTTTQLSKGGVVTVLEEKGNWLKVDYGGENPGWIKKEDTK
jgi:hypothetical protein